MTRAGRVRLALIPLALVVAGPLALAAAGSWIRFRPPEVVVPSVDPQARRERQGRLWRFTLGGTPEQLGASQARLGAELMDRADAELVASLDQHLPSRFWRFWALRLVRLKHRHLDVDLPADARRELAALARVYPDRFAAVEPTYQRLVYYHALHEITAGLDGSPLLGCTAFAAAGPATASGRLLVGRNFDFEGANALGEERAVTTVRPAGKLGFVHVAWAGMVGVVTGINEERIFVAVHAARSSATRTRGTPIAIVLRQVLEQARSLDEAVALIARAQVMVADLIVVADGARGQAAVVEKTPERTEVRRLSPEGVLVVANQLETDALAKDPQNLRAIARTTTASRRARMAELLAARRSPLDLDDAVALLRDRRLPGGAPLAKGDRRAIDASLATHAVVADATRGLLYVAEPPHVAGRFLRVDAMMALGRPSLAGDAPEALR